MADDNSYLRPGDLIEIYRPLCQHWALYVGDGYVIHVTGEGAPSHWVCPSSVSTIRATVKKELLKEVVGPDTWRVNNKYDRSRTPRPVKEIVRDAEQWIDKEVPYALLSRNCEHFVTELRYGKAVSDQATKAIVGTTTTALGILGTVAAVAVRILVKVAIRI